MASLASMITGLPYSFTAHAYDIYKSNVRSAFLRTHIDRSDFVVTVSDANRRLLDEVGGGPRRKVFVVRNGIDLERFSPGEADAGAPFTILAVARLVEKKGLAVPARKEVNRCKHEYLEASFSTSPLWCPTFERRCCAACRRPSIRRARRPWRDRGCLCPRQRIGRTVCVRLARREPYTENAEALGAPERLRAHAKAGKQHVVEGEAGAPTAGSSSPPERALAATPRPPPCQRVLGGRAPRLRLRDRRRPPPPTGSSDRRSGSPGAAAFRGRGCCRCGRRARVVSRTAPAAAARATRGRP